MTPGLADTVIDLESAAKLWLLLTHLFLTYVLISAGLLFL